MMKKGSSRFTSLRTKSVLFMMLTSLVSVFFIAVAFILYEMFMFHNNAEERILGAGRILAINSMASLSFEDRRTANETLSAVAGESSLMYSALYDANGKLFTDQKGMCWQINTSIPFDLDPLLLKKESCQWDGFFLTVSVPVYFEKDFLGQIVLVTRQTELLNRFQSYLILSLGFIFASFFIAYAFSFFSQRFLTVPVLALWEDMKEIANTKNYSVRSNIKTNDELELLGQGFNSMLDQIQEQNKDLEIQKIFLEENVQERTAELYLANQNLQQTVEELEKAKKAAEEASQAKMQFLTNISHEIRTPMNGVLGMAELLSKSELDNKQHQLLKTLYRSGKEMLAIINELLDFSRLESGKFEINMSVFDPYLLWENSLELFKVEAQKKGIELIPVIDREMPVQIQSDPDRIRQVLVNLLGNAIKFTSEGAVVLRANIISQGASKRLVFSVADTGIGISPDQQERIFLPFTQANESMVRNYGGTGLGLSIVRQIVTLLEGEISFESTFGQGTKFTVSIPVFSVDREDKHIDPALFAKTSVCSFGLTPLSHAALERILERYELKVEYFPSLEGIVDKLSVKKGQVLVFVQTDNVEELDDIIGACVSGGKKIFVRVCSFGCERDFNLQDSKADFVLSDPVRLSDVQCIIQHLVGTKNLDEKGKEEDYPEGICFDARVLLVEDNTVNQIVASKSLELFGVEVEIAENGQMAIDKFFSAKFDLIFMDCQMPVKDGYTASREIRKKEEMFGLERTPIIALTAHALAKDRTRCIESGMDGYISKPFSLKVLFDCLEKWLAPHMRQQAGDSEKPALDTTNHEPEKPSALDETILVGLRQIEATGAKGLIAELFQTYKASAGDMMAKIETGIQTNDFELLRKINHTLKSSSHNVGAAILSGLAREMEIAAREKESEKLADLAKRIFAEHQRVLEAMEKWDK